VNDNQYWQYHRNNGLTKIGFRSKERGLDKEVLRVIEGSLETASILNKAYIKKNFPNHTVIGGVDFYPYQLDEVRIEEELLDEVLLVVLPFCLALHFPLFLY